VAAGCSSAGRLSAVGQALADGQQLKGMVAAVRVAEAFTPIHPHPGIESPAGQVVLGPMSAIIDRTRDAIRHAMG
jgi:hypothetical protein